LRAYQTTIVKYHSIQSLRVGANALYNQSRYAEERKTKRARKDTRKFRVHFDREKWKVERKSPKHSEKFKELLFNATRIYTQGKNDKQPPYCIHASEA